MKLIVNEKDITQLLIGLKWAGDMEERSRSVELSYLYKPGHGMPVVEVRAGDSINLFDDAGKVFFVGMVTVVSSTLAGSEVSITARDVLWHLGKNKAAGVYQGSPEVITGKLLQEFGIEAQQLPAGAIEQTIISTGDKTIYQVIQEAYGEDFYIYAAGKKVGVAKKAVEVAAVISGNANLFDVSYKVSVENMVNQVAILDKDGAKSGLVNAPEDLKYGILQGVYKAEEGKDSQVEARKLLKGLSDASSIEAVGSFSVVAGKAVILQDTTNGFVGKFLVTSDSHSFSKGMHTMSLEVEVVK